MVVNETRSVFHISVASATFGPICLGSAKPGNNFFTYRHRPAARCLQTPLN